MFTLLFDRTAFLSVGKCCLQKHKGRWYIDLDISAPKFIVPENFLESNPALVVMDLGNFRLKTVVAEDAPTTLDEEGGGQLVLLVLFTV